MSKIDTAISLLNQAKEFMRKADADLAFDRVNSTLDLDFFESDEYNDIKEEFGVLETRYNRLQKKIRKGIIDSTYQNNEENNIASIFYSHIKTLSGVIKKQIKKIPDKKLEKSIAENPIKRTKTIVQNLKILAEGGHYGLVREKGNLSTFSLPNRPVNNPAWDNLNWKVRNNKAFKEQLSAQRYWLEKHAVNQSCKIIINLDNGVKYKTDKHALYRLKSLLEFIKTNRDLVDIVNAPTDPKGYENLLIVGNKNDLGISFLAHSEKNTGIGIEDTTISPDPEKIKEKETSFDKEFENILDHLKMDIYEARGQVIRLLEGKIEILQWQINYQNNN